MNITATMIGQSITFLVFVYFCMKFVWPALTGVMREREKRIAAGLEAAERADKDLELAKQRATDNLREAKQQAAAIVEQANKRAAQLVEQGKAQAEIEAQRIRDNARAEMEREVAQAREQLRAKVSVLAVSGAEKILRQSVDVSAHSKMLDQLAAEL